MNILYDENKVQFVTITDAQTEYTSLNLNWTKITAKFGRTINTTSIISYLDLLFCIKLKTLNIEIDDTSVNNLYQNTIYCSVCLAPLLAVNEKYYDTNTGDVLCINHINDVIHHTYTKKIF